jgi:hypothetical protein
VEWELLVRQQLERELLVRELLELMMRTTLPKRAVALIAGVTVAGAAALGARVGDLSRWTTADVVAMLALVVATAAVEQLSVRVPFGKETKHVTLTEAAFALALLLGARFSVLTMAVAIGIGVGHAMRNTAWHKLVFNVASWTLAMTAAELVFAATRPTSPVLAVTVAMASFFAVNASTVVGVIATASGRTFAQVFAPIARLEFVHATGNLALGLLAAGVWTIAPAAVLVAFPAAAVTALCYRAEAPVTPA